MTRFASTDGRLPFAKRRRLDCGRGFLVAKRLSWFTGRRDG
jgi:hypothetical protein